MASSAVMEHALRKFSEALEQNEVLGANPRLISAQETLKGLKDRVKSLQEMADRGGVETADQVTLRKGAVFLALYLENCIDQLTTALDAGGSCCGQMRYRRVMKNFDVVVDMEASAAESSAAVPHGYYYYDPRLPVAPEDVQAELLGLDGATRTLSSLLLDGEMQLKAVSVVGFAGLGKTALAMEVYRQVEGHFECQATAVVSRRPNLQTLLHHLLSQLRSEDAVWSDSDTETSPQPQQLIDEIREHLKDRRYLILLDDMWEISPEIGSLLPKNNCGSRIIITTRIRSLADSPFQEKGDIADSGPCNCDVAVYEMGCLSLSDSENLLATEIYGSMERCSDRHRNHLKVAARVFGGVPLAKIAADRLMEELIRSGNYYWQNWVPEEKAAEERILHSYTQIDPCLKAHMMLLCMFPWNFNIRREHIIRIWKAEGYANSGTGGHESAEERILEKLIDRNLILPVSRQDISQAEAWNVHYVTFMALLQRSAEEDFLITSNNLQVETSRNVRRLALHPDLLSRDEELNKLLINKRLINKRLRRLNLDFISSLSIFGKANRLPLCRFKNLRVLDVLGWEKIRKMDLRQICRMVLLRYLSLRNTKVREIPREIKNLHCLETLDLKNTEVTKLPFQVGQLPKLSDLLVGNDQDQWSSVMIPTGFRHFRSLHTLETIHLSKAWSLLHCLPQLRRVAIMCPSQGLTYSQSQKEELTCSQKEELTYSQKKLCWCLQQCRGLESLTFHGLLGCCMEFFHALRHPPRSLRELRIAGKFVCLPQWIDTGSLENLTLLEIKVCNLLPADVQRLSELPGLKHLGLGLDFIPEQEMVITGFPALNRFSVDCRVPWLSFRQEAMPELTDLELKFREGLVEQQHSTLSSIHHLQNLKRVAMYIPSLCQQSPSVQATEMALRIAVRKHRCLVNLFVNGMVVH
ncbi:hypothetical protein ACP4OV_002412 [Aristida adscensionis]